MNEILAYIGVAIMMIFGLCVVCLMVSLLAAGLAFSFFPCDESRAFLKAKFDSIFRRKHK